MGKKSKKKKAGPVSKDGAGSAAADAEEAGPSTVEPPSGPSEPSKTAPPENPERSQLPTPLSQAAAEDVKALDRYHLIAYS